MNKFVKFIFKLAAAFLAFGAFASLYISKNKNEYINIINSKLNKWTFDRLCLTDQAILLLFTSELLNTKKLILK